MKKIFLCLSVSAMAMFSATADASTYPTQICRGRACQPVSFSPKNQLLDELATLFPSTVQQIVFCQADPASRTCIKDGLEFFGYSSAATIRFNVPFARIVHVEPRSNGYGLTLDYQVQANGFYPTCTVSDGSLSLYRRGIMQLSSPLFSCQLTRSGTSRISIQFQLDYIDFEQRRMGAFYTTYVDGEVIGSGSGYALLRLSKERRIMEQRPITPDPWKAGQATPMMRLRSGQVAMPNMLGGDMMNSYNIQTNQAQWGIDSVDSQASGMGGWYLNNAGAYTPMAAPDTTWRGKLSNYWDKLLKIIYLEP